MYSGIGLGIALFGLALQVVAGIISIETQHSRTYVILTTLGGLTITILLLVNWFNIVVVTLVMIINLFLAVTSFQAAYGHLDPSKFKLPVKR